MRIRDMRRFGVHFTALLSLQLLLTGGACAAEIDYRATIGVGHSDNIRRVPTGEEEEVIGSAGLQFSIDHNSPRVFADLIGEFAYNEYREDTYDSELVGNFLGEARFRLIPERLELIVSDNFGQVLSDPFQPATPDNTENINYFTIGPDLSLSFGARTRVRIGGRYSRTTYEDSELDSDGVAGSLSVQRFLSESSFVSLNARTQTLEYDEQALNADYDQRDFYLRYEGHGARTNVGLDVGYTEIDQEALDETQDGLLLRLDVSRRISPSTMVALTLGNEFSNSGSAFAVLQEAGGGGLAAAPGLQSAQPFTNKYATLAWHFARNRSELSLLGSWADWTYDDLPSLDQELTRFGISVNRALTPLTSLSIAGSRSSARFEQTGVDYDEDTLTLSFAWQVSRSLFITLTYSYFTRDSELAATEYSENRFWLQIGYGRGEPRATPLPPRFGVDPPREGI